MTGAEGELGGQPHTMVCHKYGQTLPWMEVQVNVIKIHTLGPWGVRVIKSLS